MRRMLLQPRYARAFSSSRLVCASPRAPQTRRVAANSPEDIEYLTNRQLNYDPAAGASLPILPSFVPGTFQQFKTHHPKTVKREKSWKLLWLYAKSAASEWFTSIYCVWNMSKFSAWPYGVPIKNRVSDALRIRSTSDKAWAAGLRRQAEESYKELNKAVASKASDTIYNFALGPYIKLLQRRSQRVTKGEWSLVRHVKPIKVVSFRAMPFQDDSESSRGNGWLFQGVFKFDTMQTLNSLNQPSAGPLPEHHVVEYIVMERRGWLPNRPWTIVGSAKPGSHIGDKETTLRAGITDLELVDLVQQMEQELKKSGSR